MPRVDSISEFSNVEQISEKGYIIHDKTNSNIDKLDSDDNIFLDAEKIKNAGKEIRKAIFGEE